MKSKKMYTAETLRKDHPELADKVDAIFSIRGNRDRYQSFFILYCGRYKNSSGKARMVSIGTIVDFLHQMGHEVEYNVL